MRGDAVQRRAQILDEAQRIMGERGFNGFTLQVLADSCGLTKAGLLHYFPSKEQILIDLLKDRDDQRRTELKGFYEEVFASEITSQERKEIFIESLCIIAGKDTENPQLIKMHAMLRSEAINPAHPAHRHFLNREETRRSRLMSALASISPSPYSAARLVMAIWDGLDTQWLLEGENFDLVSEFRAALTKVLAA